MITPRSAQSPQDVADHYDDLDRFYREIWGEHLHHGLWERGDEPAAEAVRLLVTRVAELAALRPGARVCDVGCGYGATARMLAAEHGAEVTGLSLSAAQLAYARQASRGADNPTYLQRDWLRSDLPDAHFDAVIAIESTEHMADKLGCLREARRVLRPGGRLVICAWLACEAPGRLEHDHLLEPICREGRLPGMGTASEYIALLRAADLEVEAYRDLSRQVRRTWPICVGRTLRGLLREPEYRRWLLRGASNNRVFALTVLRIWLAYALGSMQYGIFAARRPAPGA